MRPRLLFPVLVLLLAALACGPFTPDPTETPLPAATDTSAPTPTVTPLPWPAGSGDCTFTTTGETIIYNRPSTEATIFFEAGAGMSEVVTGRTADGWVGFDPAIAQAANIGPFRLRWLPFAAVDLAGDCLSVEEMWSPLPGYCYDMPMEAVPVYSAPDTTSEVLATLEFGDFAAVLGRFGDDWAQVDLAPGNTGLTDIGWVQSATLNMNGSACQNLPEVAP